MTSPIKRQSSTRREHGRKRASTRALLGPDFVEEADKVLLPPPRPERDFSGYTQDRLKRSLAYSDAALRSQKRKVSPLTMHLLKLYKSSVKELMAGHYENEEDKEVLLAVVMNGERQMNMYEFLRRPSEPGTIDMVKKLTMLRRYEYASRYGDYSQDSCETLKISARELKTPYFEQLNGWNRLWTDINEDINREMHNYERWTNRDPSIRPEDIKTCLAVHKACEASGLNIAYMFQTISMYADRNSLVHMSTLHMVEKGDWYQMQGLLYRDLVDIPKVTPDHLRGTIPVLQAMVEAFIDQYFQRDPKDPLNVNKWTVRPEAHAKTAEIQGLKEKKLALIEAERKKVSKLAAERLKVMEDKYTFTHLAAAVSGLPAPSGKMSPLKRPREGDDLTMLENEHKKRRKAWEAMVSAGKQVYDRAQEYYKKHQSLEEPVDMEVWISMMHDDKEDAINKRGQTSSGVQGSSGGGHGSPAVKEKVPSPRGQDKAASPGAQEGSSKEKYQEDTTKGRHPKGKAPDGTCRGKGAEVTSKDKGPEGTSKGRNPEGTSAGRLAEVTSKGKGSVVTTKGKGLEGTSKGKRPEGTSKGTNPEGSTTMRHNL